MSNISAYSQTAASNNAAPPNGWPEGQAPSTVNDCAREMMAGIARWYAHLDNSLTSTGSSNAYVLTTGSSHVALADIGIVAFKANHTNSGAATLAVDGLTSKSIYWNGAALISGSLVSGNTYAVAYNATGDVYDLLVNPVDLPSLKTRGMTYPTTDGTSGQYITTNGSGVLSFANASQNITRSGRTSNTILAAGDKATLIDVTSGTFSQTITAAATLGDGWFCYYRNSGTGDITIDPNASETIDGLTSYIIYPGESRLIICDGSAFYTQILSSFSKRFTSSGTFTKPPGYKAFEGIAWSAGQSGQNPASAVNSRGGNAGGAFAFTFPESQVGTTETVTIGAGGSGNLAAGGNTSLGSLLVVRGANGSNSGCITLDGSNVFLSSSGGYAFGAIESSGALMNTVWGGAGASTNSYTNVGSSIYGGGAGGSLTSAAAATSAGTSIFGGNGGNASAAGTASNGSQPGGGGGATHTGTSGDGGDGQLDIKGIA